MIHLRARRRLPDLVGGTLRGPVAAALQSHVRRCSRCQRILAELEACERLLAQLPPACVPLEAPGTASPRLATLSRWAGAPPPSRWPEVGATALAAAFTAALLLLAATAGQWEAPDLRRTDTVAVVALVPDLQVLPAGRWR
jgi:hypothetical protein